MIPIGSFTCRGVPDRDETARHRAHLFPIGMKWRFLSVAHARSGQTRGAPRRHCRHPLDPLPSARGSILTLAQHLAAAGIVAVITGICYGRSMLDPSGGLAAWVVGYVALAFGGVSIFSALLGFFLAVNVVRRVASRTLSHRLPPGYEPVGAKGSRRDAWQIFANGGVALALVPVFHFAPTAAILAALLGSIAASSADTFASELGVYARKAPVLITTLQPIAAGLSGGVSLTGNVAAAVGALVPLALYNLTGGKTSPSLWAACLLAGIGGSTIDSLVGALWQEKRSCPSCSRLTERPEHCGVPTVHAGGVAGLGNDVVNLVGSATGAIIAAGVSLAWPP